MFVNLDGQRIYYQTTGKGPNLILVHGWKQDSSTWWPVVDLLKDKFKLWLIDLPGFGRSEAPKKTWSIFDYADNLAHFIKENKIKNPIVLGHSLGGNITIVLANKYPNLISKLILEGASGVRPKSVFRSFLIIPSKVIKYLVPNLFNLKEKLRLKLYGAIGSDYLGAGDLRKTFTKIVNQDASRYAEKISLPTLILWGEQDKEVPLDHAKKLYHLIENSRIEVMENTGHFPHLENPNIVTHYVKDFV